jgi:hypothetical protein
VKLKRMAAAVVIALAPIGAVAVTTLPAQAYTSTSFSHTCRTSDGTYSLVISGNWHRASDGSTVTLANAVVHNASGRGWDVDSDHWEDLSTGAVVRGYGGYIGVGYSFPTWNPNAWYRTGHAIQWAVTGHLDSNSAVTITSCAVTP